MGQKIRLTWRDSNHQVVIEECFLLAEEDVVFAGSEPIEGAVDMLYKSGYVVFEDEVGLFGLPPDQVILIEVA